MTTKPKARKFRIRRNAPVSAPKAASPQANEDGFGDAPFPGSAKAEGQVTDIAEIRNEGLTGRQLRMARRLAQKQGLQPKSDFDAVRLLRAQGIDPFDRSNMLELVVAKEGAESKTEDPAEVRTTLPQTIQREKQTLPSEAVQDDMLKMHELERIQHDIVQRRRRNVVALIARLAVFILLPTLVGFYYFAFVATPSYATKSEFIVQQAETPTAGGGLLGGTSLATSQDSIMVQDFLTSREALLRLDSDHDYRSHFSNPAIDALQRVPAGSSNEALYKHYQDHVILSYDPTEGVIRMEVAALSPEMSRTFSEALIGYAEERVDSVTERKRSDQMDGARLSFDEAEAKMVAAQEKVLDLQQRLGVIDPASETSALMSQISNFEVQLAEKRLQLQQLLDNAQPNRARVAGVEGDIARLEALIADLRSQLTTESAGAGSLANVTAQLRIAEVDLETRTMMMQEALQQMEAARVEANRQVRFLSMGVAPIPPDEPTYPRVFENTLITFLVFGALYLLGSITAGILREQVSH